MEGMKPARKVVRVRRVAPVERLLDDNDVDDMLDVFAMQDADEVAVQVNVPEEPRSGFMRKVVVPPLAPKAVVEEEIEEITDGINEGWDDDVVA